ncbi:hypothetical protein [Rhizobium sp. C4]|uniref:hypothetical protein n=1 Tax=Rhizobium sp. C4 TaxID=1349800 RepID=UPI001E298BBF|nr:hypothetical protein [Rhizobium sp. C4]MCD2171339.1 hypothetical protein [Rhizobium sp. C4]
MRISQNTASAAAYTPAAAAEHKGRELSKTQQAVQAQLAHNKQQAKVDADKLAKVSGKPVANDAATAKAGAAAASASGAAATAAATSATTSTKAAANAKGVDAAETTQAAQKKPAKPQTVFEKQHAHNQAMAKIHASMLDKVANPATPKTDTAQPSAAAAQAATAKYMENSGQSTGTTTTHFRA